MSVSKVLVEAIARHEEFKQLDPTNVRLGMDLGDLYHEANRFDDAIASYRACLVAMPDHAPARSRLASVMLSLHQFAEAEQMLRQLIDAGDPAPELRHNLGLALYFQRRWDEARQCFAQAAQAGLARPDTFDYWVRTLRQLGHTEAAIEVCRHWVEVADGLDPQRQAKGVLAELYMAEGDQAKAQRLASEVVAAFPTDPSANVVLGQLALNRQDDAQARQRFEVALGHDTDNADGWQGLGMLHLRQGEFAQAIQSLENAVRASPEQLGGLNLLGWSKLHSGDAEGARDVFLQALEVDHSFGESHGGLASALAALGETERAERAIKVARRLNPGGFGADYAQTTLLAAKGQQQAAEQVIGQALKRELPDGVPLMDHLQAMTLRRAHRLH